MNSRMEFDIKHEEDPLTITEIKSEPQENTVAVMAESEECKYFFEHVDIKPDIKLISQLAFTMSEVEDTQENVMKLVEDKKKSQEEQKNTEDEEINGLLLVQDSCESYRIDLQEESVSVQTGENVIIFPESNNFGFCNKNFSDENNYTNMYVHSGDKSYTCNFCTKTFSCKYHVIRHIRTHRNVKPFTCEICSKSFSRKCHLNDHNRLHTNEKPFICNICGKSFSHRSSLTGHTRIHTNIQPFSCNICTRSFFDKSNLVTHIRTHTKEKPFTCTICIKSFSRKTHLASHIRTHK